MPSRFAQRRPWPSGLCTGFLQTQSCTHWLLQPAGLSVPHQECGGLQGALASTASCGSKELGSQSLGHHLFTKTAVQTVSSLCPVPRSQPAGLPPGGQLSEGGFPQWLSKATKKPSSPEPTITSLPRSSLTTWALYSPWSDVPSHHLYSSLNSNHPLIITLCLALCRAHCVTHLVESLLLHPRGQVSFSSPCRREGRCRASPGGLGFQTNLPVGAKPCPSALVFLVTQGVLGPLSFSTGLDTFSDYIASSQMRNEVRTRMFPRAEMAASVTGEGSPRESSKC